MTVGDRCRKQFSGVGRCFARMTDVHVADIRGGLASWRWVIALAFTALLSMFSILRYHLYLAQGWDLGFYEQGLWALYHEGFHAWSSWGQYPVLSRSMAWILWPLSVPYHFFGLGFLLTLQAFAYGSSFLFLYDWMHFRQMPPAKVHLVGWLFLANPVAWGIVLFDFHPAVLAIPCILASLTLADRGLVRAALLWLVPALLCQDLVIPIVGLVGVIWVLKGRFDLGVGAIVLAGLAAAMDLAAFRHLGTGLTIQRILYFQTTHMTLTFSHLGTLRAAEYLIWIFVPALLFGVSWSSVVWLVPVLVLAGLNVGSANPLATSPFSNFSILTLPFVTFFMAFSVSVAPGARRRFSIALYALLFLAFLWHEAGLRHLAPSIQQGTALSQAIADIPADALVIAQNQVAPHVASRRSILAMASTRVYPRGGYEILDLNHSATLSNVALLGLLTRAQRSGHVVYKNQGIYVIHLTNNVRGQ